MIGDTDTQMKEQEEFRLNDDKNNTESEMEVEGGGQALNFKESSMEFEDDEEEVVEDEQLEDQGVKMIKMKDGSIKKTSPGR